MFPRVSKFSSAFGSTHATQSPFWSPFVFITLRIAFPVRPLYSYPYKLPGGCPLWAPCSDLSSLRVGPFARVCLSGRSGKRFRITLLRTLWLVRKYQLLCFQANPNSFAKTPGVGVTEHNQTAMVGAPSSVAGCSISATGASSDHKNRSQGASCRLPDRVP
jgi:hypothetical protein